MVWIGVYWRKETKVDLFIWKYVWKWYIVSIKVFDGINFFPFCANHFGIAGKYLFTFHHPCVLRANCPTHYPYILGVLMSEIYICLLNKYIYIYTSRYITYLLRMYTLYVHLFAGCISVASTYISVVRASSYLTGQFLSQDAALHRRDWFERARQMIASLECHSRIDRWEPIYFHVLYTL